MANSFMALGGEVPFEEAKETLPADLVSIIAGNTIAYRVTLTQKLADKFKIDKKEEALLKQKAKTLGEMEWIKREILEWEWQEEYGAFFSFRRDGVLSLGAVVTAVGFGIMSMITVRARAYRYVMFPKDLRKKLFGLGYVWTDEVDFERDGLAILALYAKVAEPISKEELDTLSRDKDSLLIRDRLIVKLNSNKSMSKEEVESLISDSIIKALREKFINFSIYLEPRYDISQMKVIVPRGFLFSKALLLKMVKSVRRYYRDKDYFLIEV